MLCSLGPASQPAISFVLQFIAFKSVWNGSIFSIFRRSRADFLLPQILQIKTVVKGIDALS